MSTVLHFRVDPTLAEALDELVEQTRRAGNPEVSRSALIRMILQEALATKKSRALYQEAFAQLYNRVGNIVNQALTEVGERIAELIDESGG